jgi:hypothetical protein
MTALNKVMAPHLRAASACPLEDLRVAVEVALPGSCVRLKARVEMPMHLETCTYIGAYASVKYADCSKGRCLSTRLPTHARRLRHLHPRERQLCPLSATYTGM